MAASDWTELRQMQWALADLVLGSGMEEGDQAIYHTSRQGDIEVRVQNWDWENGKVYVRNMVAPHTQSSADPRLLELKKKEKEEEQE